MTTDGDTNAVKVEGAGVKCPHVYLPRVAKGAEITKTALGKLMHTIWDRLNDDKRLLLLVSKENRSGMGHQGCVCQSSTIS